MTNKDLPKKADLHCHILPYVDDGAFDKAESIELLKMFREQNVETICVTPHLRKGMFETPDAKIIRQFERLKMRAEAENLQFNLFLSREYHADSLFYGRLKQGKLITIGEGKYILIEYSGRHTFEDIQKSVRRITRFGYLPLIAHVERYNITDTEQIKQLKELGAQIQVNAGSILGREGRKQANWTKKLLKEQLVDVVASDAHDPVYRPPEHDKCWKYLEKKYGKEYTEKLMYENPMKIINGK